MTAESALETPLIVVAAILVVIVSIFMMVWALLKSAALQQPALLVLSLSMLTLLAIVGGIFTTQDEPWSIAAAGIGALAGSVSAMYGQTTRVIRVRQQEGGEEVGDADDDQ